MSSYSLAAILQSELETAEMIIFERDSEIQRLRAQIVDMQRVVAATEWADTVLAWDSAAEQIQQELGL